MKRMLRCWSVWVILLLLLPLGIGVSYGASKFPDKPIVLVVHAAAGGGSDIFARTLSAAFEKEKILPQPIVVENKPGGSGAIAFSYVAGKKGDPYFLLTAVTSFLTTPLMRNIGVGLKDFTPIANFAFDEYMVIVRNESKFKSMKDIIDQARATPQNLPHSGANIPNVLTLHSEEPSPSPTTYHMINSLQC